VLDLLRVRYSALHATVAQMHLQHGKRELSVSANTCGAMGCTAH
jgi:hypothetical protein